MSRHIVLVSYDEQLLIARRRTLEQQGYRVSSAVGFLEAMRTCERSACDLLVLGHSIPRRDKKLLIQAFRADSDAPILSLWTRDEGVTDGVNYLAFTDNPDTLLANVAAILAKSTSAEASG